MGLTNVTQTVLVATVVTTITFLGTFLYKKWKQVKIPSNWEKVGSVKKLHLYPLKSGHRVELQRAEVTEVGIKQTNEDSKAFQLLDRIFVVYGAKDNEFRTARTYPKMVSIKVSVYDENHFALDAPTMRPIYVKIPNRQENQIVDVKFRQNEKVQAVDCGDEAATWLSRYIMRTDSGLRLGYHDQSQRRDIMKYQSERLGFYKNFTNKATGLFSDLTSVSLINQHSVNDLNKRIPNSDVTAENFRHNIIIDGPNLSPYDEDHWAWIKIGEDAIFRNVKDCTRCILTTVNPEKATKNAQREPLKTLEQYRKNSGPEGSPILGNNLEVKKVGIISVGDPVYIVKLETK